MATVVFVLFAVLVILGAVLALTGRTDVRLADPAPDPTGLPEGPLSPESVEGLRFRVGLRGYRMEEVDAALAALAAQIRAQQALPEGGVAEEPRSDGSAPPPE